MARKVFVFVKGALESVVWDPEKNRPLAEFSREGLFKTKDETVAKRLLDMGYMLKSDFPYGPPPGGFEPKENPYGEINAGDPNVKIRVPKTEAADLLETMRKAKEKEEEDFGESEADEEVSEEADEDEKPKKKKKAKSKKSTKSAKKTKKIRKKKKTKKE